MKFLAAFLLAVATTSLAQTFTPVPTMPVGSFLNSLGVNTHSEYTDGAYSRSGETLLELKYLGINNVRDAVPTHLASDPGNFAMFDQATRFLMGNGIKFDLLTNCNTPVSSYITEIDSLKASFSGAINAVEGTNEVNNQPCNQAGGTSEANAEAFQAQLYSTVHSDSKLGGVPVYDFTGGTRASSIQSRADFANQHPYPNLSRGTTVYARMVSDYAAQYSTTFPDVITEDGFYSTPDGGDGVDETSQAVGELQIFLSAAALGIPHTYLYELKDAYGPGSPAYATWGLFESVTGQPKVAAKAIHNLTTTLGWLPQGPSSTTVNASVLGAPADSHTFALTDAAGGVLLFVWRDVPSWSVTQQKTLLPAPVQVTVALDHACSVAYSFDPLHNTTTAISKSANGYVLGEEPYPVGLYCTK